MSCVQAHPEYTAERVHAFVADLTEDDLCAHVPVHSVDCATAVSPCLYLLCLCFPLPWHPLSLHPLPLLPLPLLPLPLLLVCEP